MEGFEPVGPDILEFEDILDRSHDLPTGRDAKCKGDDDSYSGDDQGVGQISSGSGESTEDENKSPPVTEIRRNILDIITQNDERGVTYREICTELNQVRNIKCECNVLKCQLRSLVKEKVIQRNGKKYKLFHTRHGSGRKVKGEHSRGEMIGSPDKPPSSTTGRNTKEKRIAGSPDKPPSSTTGRNTKEKRIAGKSAEVRKTKKAAEVATNVKYRLASRRTSSENDDDN